MKNTMLNVVERDIADLRPYARNARTHSKKQIKQIAASIERFGFTNPVLVSGDLEIIAGHGRLEAAKLLGWRRVPTLALSHLTEDERRAYVLADNKLALNAGWDKETLAIELQALVDCDFDIEVTGFSLAEGDFALVDAREADPALPMHRRTPCPSRRVLRSHARATSGNLAITACYAVILAIVGPWIS